MSKTDELKKLAEKITGETPSGRRASNVVEFIADKISGDTKDATTISESIAYLTDVYEGGGTLQEKEVTITENGTTTVTPDEEYDGLSSVEVTTNVSSENNAHIDFHDVSAESQYMDGYNGGIRTVIQKATIDCSIVPTLEYKTLSHFFAMGHHLTNAVLLNTDGITVFSALFYECRMLTEYSVTVNNPTNLASMFEGCKSLVNMTNIFDLSHITTASYEGNAGLYHIFYNCNSLSNESLNNIAKSLLTVPSNYGYKKLSHLGLNTNQQNAIKNMEEWTTLSANGWT